MPRWRQSLANTASVCLRRAGYSMIPGLQGGTGEAREKGTAFHAGAEVYYLARKADPSIFVPDAVLMQQVYDAAWASLDSVEEIEWETSLQQVKETVGAMLFAYFNGQHQWPAEYEVLEVEWRFDIDDGTEWVDSGTADLVLRNTVTGETILADHKTSGRKWSADKGSPRKSAQPAAYVDAWMRTTGERINWFVYDVMTTTKFDFDRRWFEVSDEDLARYTETKRILVPLLSLPVESLPGSPDSNLCSSKWCDYWDLCPFGGGKVEAA